MPCYQMLTLQAVGIHRTVKQQVLYHRRKLQNSHHERRELSRVICAGPTAQSASFPAPLASSLKKVLTVVLSLLRFI